MFLFGTIEFLCWEIAAMSFVPAKGKEVHSGNIEAVSTKEKSKFPQDFFPEVRLYFYRH
jgi:inositol-1,4,5-trisphosphate 5-phosphatase